VRVSDRCPATSREVLERLLEIATAAADAPIGLIVCHDPRKVLASVGVAGESEAHALTELTIGLDEPVVLNDVPEGRLRGARFVAAAPMQRAGRRIGAVVIARPEPGGPDPKLSRLLGDVAVLATEEFERERERAEGDKERETLLAELDHRVKNVLAAVQSLATQSARRAVSLDGFLRTFSGRLKAMASAQELLTATRWRGAGLHHLAAAELGGLAPGQTRWEGPELFLTPRAATAVSLALHELAINATKYGALSTDTGVVEVRWRRTGDGGFELDWTEQGGPPVSPPTREGFGTLLIRDVTGRELGGESTLEFPRVGARARLEAAPAALAEDSASGSPKSAAAAPVSGAGESRGPTPKPEGHVRGLKVLIVEDAVLLAWELEVGLTEAGAKVVGSAAEVGEAMELTGQPIDAAVLDANLNGESVRPVAEALAAKGVPFIFATGYGENRGAPEGFDVPIIRKPYDITQIVAALVEITGRAA
jgi:two-component sensor histidine kinase